MFDFGDRLYIQPFSPIFASVDKELLQFVIRDGFIIDVTEDMFTEGKTEFLENGDISQKPGFISFKVPVVQGSPKVYTYSGKDIVNNKIILPFQKFNHDISDDEINSTTLLEVNNELWHRVSNFTNKVSGLKENLQSDNVFQLLFDKYKRYVIEFSETRNVPKPTDEIKIQLLRTEGSKGNIGKNMINVLLPSTSKNIVKNETRDFYLSIDSISVTNEEEVAGRF